MWRIVGAPLRFAASLIKITLMLALLSASPVATRSDRRARPVDLVDPFIGTAGDGNVFPGASLPFGFVQVSPDTGPGSGAAGYKFERYIDGFSQQHITGMGGPLFGEISLLPVTGDVADPAHASSTGKYAEAASPGYYAVALLPWNTRAELTASAHVAWHRYTFPPSGDGHILVNVGHVLFGTDVGWTSASPVLGTVQVDKTRREVTGEMLYQGGRGDRQWHAFFAARFDQPISSTRAWDDGGWRAAGSRVAGGRQIGIELSFDPAARVVGRVAVSFKSIARARQNLKPESGIGFDAARLAARRSWTKALGAIEVGGATSDQRRQFYTALYRAQLTPNDWTGEAPADYGDAPYYENMLCLWDTFRTVYPLLTLIRPEVQTGIVNTLLAHYRHGGWTGDAHSVGQYEHVQNGSNADVVIADAYVKRLPGVDWKLAYAAVRKNAFIDNDPRAERRPQKGRYRLDDYRSYGFVPTDISPDPNVQGVSRSLEYAYDDFAVLTLARDLGTPRDIADLETRVRWYRHLWDPASRFMRGRTRDGGWSMPFAPLALATDRQYYEGTAWTWSWYVPHDVQGLIDLLGNKDAFVARLTDAVEHHYEAYNEPGMLQTYLFTFAGRPDLTQHYVRTALSNFSSAVDGLPGNDDSGTTSAWLVWSMIGLYPNAGQDYYLIGSPSFTRAAIALGNGRKLNILAPGASPANAYIRSATFNGRSWNRAWIRHSDIAKGGTLVLNMQATPSRWGQNEPPPSLTTSRRR